jgi:hydroxymethylpyrimidine pyrophosphatase-like HAD family hydrolase
MPSTGPRISPRNCAALQAAEAAGMEVVIATGRRQAYAMPLIAQVGLDENSVMISSNGAVVRGFDGHLLDRRFLPVETARQLCVALRGYGTMVFTFDREGTGALVIESLQQLHARIDRWVEANRPYLLEVQPIERAFDAGEEPIQGMVCGTVAEMMAAEKHLLLSDVAGQIAMHRTEYAAHNLNDLEMLEYAGRAVVMANSGEEVLALARRRGWEITASNDDDGVALAVEEVVRRAPARQDAEGNGDEAIAGSTVVEFAQ